MTLYEMLDVTFYYQKVRIYVCNAFDQNIPIFVGSVSEARRNESDVWDHLMGQIEQYFCKGSTLIIKVKDKYYEDEFEKHYLHSDKWGPERNQRPWLYSCEIDEDVKRLENEI